MTQPNQHHGEAKRLWAQNALHAMQVSVAE
jgi:hypothetical protein